MSSASADNVQRGSCNVRKRGFLEYIFATNEIKTLYAGTSGKPHMRLTRIILLIQESSLHSITLSEQIWVTSTLLVAIKYLFMSQQDGLSC